MSKKKKDVCDMSKEEFRAHKAAWEEHVREKYKEGTVFTLSQNWIGYKKGLRLICTWRVICDRDVVVVLYENGSQSTLPIDGDPFFEATGEQMPIEEFVIHDVIRRKRNDNG
jgi:hypothetical protein